MSETKESKKPIKGGEFLIRSIETDEIFTPEGYNEEQRMIAQTCLDFIRQEIEPDADKLDAMTEGLMQSKLDKAGELGMLGLSVPEQYGGMGVDFPTSLLATEYLGRGNSFSVAYGAHTGIGTLPILYFGTEDQKQKYIPKLASGEWKAAYCLTEPSSGSDANSGKTKAILSDDGKYYTLNGQKMWITNGGFANVFTVFAKIGDDENLTGFIVDADSEGISLNPEEKKMGIKGSSTRQVFFNNVKVPAENLLGERQGGFKIAVNILNIGRIKLAAGVLGGAKETINYTVQYANEREQFGRSISKYGAIRQKLAEQVIRTFALESATYRAGFDIENLIHKLVEEGMDKQKATLEGIKEYAAECAILKVVGSETLDYVVDEGVQVHGGMGYSAESKVERAYRDSRINRIFEGTNEINRMLTVDMILKKAMKGELDLMGPAQAVAGELMSIPDFDSGSDELFAEEKKYIENFKKAILMVAGSAAQKLMMELAKQQEILINIANMINYTYVAESTLKRVEKMVAAKGEAACQEYIAIVKTYIFDAADYINKQGKDALMGFVEGDELRMMMMGMKRFTKVEAYNTKNARQLIAQKLIDKNEYCFSDALNQ
ncbi:acyl-CoA dehydrogenase family protein [Paracrocinitomix mangrovi]|uniref:acyl-CoA dehydrogenase family protein n=1 Tax=Paracrocinitomix mangrovi TaxID=2862509 RepID=UPI001C8D3DE1|nr:acyl-CoA dehydrogenase family protein [Paracrocinitomix mangrovi]UKN02986.1 acyl-CoA dehydrogenase family protein [Paracrocinitomix mangrovi]